MRILSSVTTVVLALVIAGAVLAADGQKDTSGKQSRGKREVRAGRDIFKVIKGLDLSADQQAKVADLKKESDTKSKAIADKRDAVPTDQQKKDRDEAVKAALAAGKSGPGVTRAARDAMKLTTDQQAKLSDLGKEATALRKEVGQKVLGLLTAEQKDKVILSLLYPEQKQKAPHRGGRRKGTQPATAEAAQPKDAAPNPAPKP
jgi:Spy/CpxP family protein refolding chaperone